MTVGKEDSQNTGSTEQGAGDADTQEYSEVDLASFTLQSKSHMTNGSSPTPWARLGLGEPCVLDRAKSIQMDSISVDKNFPNIELSKNEVQVGRADVLRASGEEDLHVSKAHCRIWRSSDTGSCYIQNLSVNGTLVQGKPVEKDQQVTLQQGDEVALGPHTSGCPVFVFQIINKVQLEHQKRGLQVEMQTIAGDPVDQGDTNAPGAKRPKIMENLDTFKCSICLNVWHDVVSLTPCLHSFCNSCFSDWYRRSRKTGTECKCPQCRGTVSSASRNHTLRSLVEDLLKEDPSLCLSPKHIMEMEKKSLFKAGSESQFKFGRDPSHRADYETGLEDHEPFSSEDDGDDEEDDEDEDYGVCFQCSAEGDTAIPGAFRCAPEQIHLACHGCGGLFPERNDLESDTQKCQFCTRPYCKSYWESQNLLHVTHLLSGACSRIQPISQREVLDLPRKTYNGNGYEQEVTRKYIAEQGLSVQTVVKDWLPRLDSGQAGQPRNCASTQHRITSASAVCDDCAEDVIAHLMYEFRRFVPNTELPPEAAGRSNCWYGYDCRTQHHKESHARKHNHVCEPSSLRNNPGPR